MLNTKKKVVFINGKVLMPLQINKTAVIYHNGGKITTSLVVAVKKISKKSIIFETLNYVYCVVPEILPATRVMDEKTLICA